uniref:Uncharacterized protein n=1 Tax=Myotis myotis TaxID=51298 RepID=A0A7J7SC81_MYOMY|nr:hypothetical protein mMyoMyo1_009493 [Myotis myotis]
MLPWTSLYAFLFAHLFSFLLGVYPGRELLSQTVTLRVTCEGVCRLHRFTPTAMHGGSDFSASGFSLDQLLTSGSACVGSSAGPVSHLKHFRPRSPLPSGDVAWPRLGGPWEEVLSPCKSLFRPAWHYTASPTSPQDGQVPGPRGAANTGMVRALWRQPLRTHVVPIRRALRSVRLSTTYYY